MIIQVYEDEDFITREYSSNKENKIEKENKTLVISYEKSNNDDISCLTVLKIKNNGGIKILNEFTSEKADEIYNLLVNKNE